MGSAENEQYDQTLDSILVGPIPMGVNKFVFQVRATPCGHYYAQACRDDDTRLVAGHAPPPHTTAPHALPTFTAHSVSEETSPGHGHTSP